MRVAARSKKRAPSHRAAERQQRLNAQRESFGTPSTMLMPRTQPIAFIAAEEEELVFHDRSAEARAELIEPQRRFLKSRSNQLRASSLSLRKYSKTEP